MGKTKKGTTQFNSTLIQSQASSTVSFGGMPVMQAANTQVEFSPTVPLISGTT